MIALLTGASSDIGIDIAYNLAKNNYNLVLCYYTKKDKLESIKKNIEENYNVNVFLTKLDVTKELEVNNLFNIIKNKYEKLDLLINLASLSLDNDMSSKSYEEFMQVVGVNLGGTFLVTKYFSRIMNKGLIINMSSTDGIDTYNNISMDYCSSKAGIINITKCLAMELTNNKVVAIAPNWVDTSSVREMNQEYLKEELIRVGQKKLLKVNDISKIVLEIMNNEKCESGTIIEVR